MDGTAKGQVTAASARLPERQREALALLEEQGFSYDDIATELDTTWACVGQLVAHARINLYDEVHGTILASVAPSPDCERAVGLIAAREDGELGERAEASWLDAHLQDCDRCRRGVEEMRDAGLASRDASAGAVDATPAAVARLRPRRIALMVCAAALLLLAGVATAFVRDGRRSTPVGPAVSAADRSKPALRDPAADGKRGEKAGPREGKRTPVGKQAASREATAAGGAPAAPTSPVATEVPVAAPEAPAGGEGGSANQPSGKAAVDPPQQTAAPRPKPAPSTASSPTPSTAPAPAPIAEPPPAEEPSEEPPRRREPPGKPAHAGPE